MLLYRNTETCICLRKLESELRGNFDWLKGEERQLWREWGPRHKILSRLNCGTDALPGALDVAQFGMSLADAHAEGEFAREFGVGDVELAAAIHGVENALIDCVAGAVAEADEIQRGGSGQFEILVGLHPRGELLGEFDVAANVELQALDAVVANHKPQLERAKAAA